MYINSKNLNEIFFYLRPRSNKKNGSNESEALAFYLINSFLQSSKYIDAVDEINKIKKM